jgi:hypothetical protein
MKRSSHRRDETEYVGTVASNGPVIPVRDELASRMGVFGEEHTPVSGCQPHTHTAYIVLGLNPGLSGEKPT